MSGRRKNIALCSPAFEHGDAVSNDIRGMYDVLDAQGHNVAIFVQDCMVDDARVRPLAEIDGHLTGGEDLFIYHYAIGWDAGLGLLERLRCRKVVKYHNVTPPEFFERINSGYAAVCTAGRQQLPRLVGADADAYIGCSRFSVEDFIGLGIDRGRCHVVPPFHHVDRLRETDANLDLLDRLNDGKITLLVVGRLAPNKGHNRIIDAFEYYHRLYNPESRLLIVGGEDPQLSVYTQPLRRRVAMSGLEGDVLFTGKVTDAELKTCYLAADVFVMASLHEGFCVPLVEAMSMKIPVIALGSSAVPETVGGAGIVWDHWDPEIVAASIHAVVEDDDVRFALGKAGWDRYRTRFSNDQIARTFLNALEGIL